MANPNQEDLEEMTDEEIDARSEDLDRLTKLLTQARDLADELNLERTGGALAMLIDGDFTNNELRAAYYRNECGERW